MRRKRARKVINNRRGPSPARLSHRATVEEAEEQWATVAHLLDLAGLEYERKKTAFMTLWLGSENPTADVKIRQLVEELPLFPRHMEWEVEFHCGHRERRYADDIVQMGYRKELAERHLPIRVTNRDCHACREAAFAADEARRYWKEVEAGVWDYEPDPFEEPAREEMPEELIFELNWGG